MGFSLNPKLKTLSLIAGLAFILTGCGINGSIKSKAKLAAVQLGAMPTGTGITSGGGTAAATAGGYTVNSSVGEVFAEVSMTTAGGYTVQMNAQGMSN